MVLRRLVALRHGETDWNATTRMQGHRDIPLNDRGRAQAGSVAPALAAMRPGLLVSSDLSRARRTADIVADHLGLTVRVDARLRETGLGQWEGLARDEVRDGWPEQWRQWQHRDPRVAPPGGETRVDVSARAAAVVEDLDALTDGLSLADDTALLVTHGGLIVGLIGRLLGVPADHWGALGGMANCHYAVLDRRDHRWRLWAYNVGPDAASPR